MRRRQLLVAAATAVIAACAGPAASPPAGGSSGASRPSSPDAANPGRNIWPGFLSGSSTQVREAYAFAAQHQDELRYIPCYCGCVGSGHASNAECFVRSRAADGWLVLDPHGSACGTCVGIALDVRTMLGTKTALREIRATIDRRWSAAGPGTRTPMP